MRWTPPIFRHVASTAANGGRMTKFGSALAQRTSAGCGGVGLVCSSTFDRGGDAMTRHWITAVMVGMLALAMTAPAWADCKAEAQLCPTTGCTLGSASGQAEVKVQTAVAANPLLKIKAVNAANKFDADVQGLGSELPYKVTTFNGTSETAHAFFFTNASGQADVDIKVLSNTCSIKTVKVTKFGTSIVVLQGTLDRKSTRLNSSHTVISYAVFCLKKKTHR